MNFIKEKQHGSLRKGDGMEKPNGGETGGNTRSGYLKLVGSSKIVEILDSDH